MQVRDLRRAGHLPSLFAALIHFDVSFMVWVMLGALGAFISEDLALSPSAKGLMVAVPLLSAAVFRITLGILSDRFGPKRVGTVSMAVATGPLLLGWLAGNSLGEVLAVGVLLGVAGASFAVSLPLASRWYPPRLQGLAMGIAGAGNSGTVITALVAPRLAEAYGWHAVMGMAIVPVVLAFAAFVLMARQPPEAPRRGSLSNMRELLREADAWRMCAMYAVTFGSFVGLASFLPIFLHDQYGLTKVDAATVAAAGGAMGSLLRPIGGHLADRAGGTSVLLGVYGVAGALLLFAAGLPAVGPAALAFVVTMGAFGLGNGAVFQLVGVRYRERIGSITGLVGAAGGLGGFLLPTILGSLRDLAGSYGAGLAVIALAAGAALVGTLITRGTWRASPAMAGASV